MPRFFSIVGMGMKIFSIWKNYGHLKGMYNENGAFEGSFSVYVQ